MTDLTRKQRLFAEEYLCDLNATQAAIRAGYSPRSAPVQGCRLLSNAKVSAAVQAGHQTKLARVEEEATEAVLSRQQVLQEDSLIARGNLFDFIEDINKGGVVWKSPADLPPELQRVVQEFRYDPEKRSVTIKLHSKHPSLERLAKHHQLFSGPEPEPDQSSQPDPNRVEEAQTPEEARYEFGRYMYHIADQMGLMDGTVREMVVALGAMETEA